MIARPAANCLELIPDDWTKPVQGAPLPAADTLVEWQVFGDKQTGRLDVANDRQQDTITILGKCEKRDAEVVQALTPRTLLQRLTPW